MVSERLAGSVAVVDASSTGNHKSAAKVAVASGHGAVATVPSLHGTRSAVTNGPASVTFTAAQRAQFARLTATPQQRAKLVADMRAAFAGVAEVGSAGQASTDAASWAAGMSGDHFWITASYYDVASGAIWGAVRACSTRIPSWLCNAAGQALSSWASGWGWASDHGVWAAIYWLPPRITGGRW